MVEEDRIAGEWFKKIFDDRVRDTTANRVPVLKNMDEERKQNIVSDSCYLPGCH